MFAPVGFSLAACGSNGAVQSHGPDAETADASDGSAPSKEAAVDAPAESSTFPCGTEICNAGVEFCFQQGNGIGVGDATAPFSYSCKAVPAACLSNATCACIESAPDSGAGSCACDQVGGDLVVTCSEA
jgi:hypothetical protein